MSAKFKIILCAVLSLLSCAQMVKSDEKATIGLADLLARKPGADGSGLRIGQVEADTGSGAYQANPASSGQPESKFSYFDADSTYPTAGVYDANKQSGHANSVAYNYFGLNAGVATDVSEIYVFDANTFYNQIIGPGATDIGAKVINQSFIFTGNPQDLTGIEKNYDNYAIRHNVLFVNGTNNGGGSAVATPGTMYNGITVGREDLDSSYGPTYDGRSKPDLIAPGSASSYSTPYVAGSAAVLIEAGLLNEGGAGTATAASDPRTVKALLINGAVKDDTWAHSTTQPLDTRKGAGMLQIDHSYSMLEGGKHNSISGSNESSGGVHIPSSSTVGNVDSTIGWNFDTITDTSTGNSSPNPADRVENYYFDHSTVKDLVATLTWSKLRNASGIKNLDLYLFNANTGAVVDSSVSTVDNVEHIYSRDLPAGRYVLQVVKRGSNFASRTETYALAFRFSDPAPDAPSALAAVGTSTSTVDLTWTDNSSDELAFELQRSLYSSQLFNTIATLPADAVSYADTGLATGTTYFYRVKATNAAGDSFYSNEGSAKTYSNLESWRLANFGDIGNSGVGANDEDPDSDGLRNLVEYAIGTDPTSAAGANGGMSQPKASIVTDGGSDYLQLTVNRVEIKPELDYFVEVSSDLVTPTWTVATDIIENSATVLRVRDNVVLGSGLVRFIRLRVEEK